MPSRALGRARSGSWASTDSASGPAAAARAAATSASRRATRGPGHLALGVERGGGLVATLEIAQPLLGRIAPLQHLGEGLAVLAPQLLEQLAAGPHVGLALWIALDGLAPMAHVGGHVGQLGGDPVQPRRGVGERRPVVQRGEGPRHRVGGAVVAGERLDRDRGRLPVTGGVGQQLGLVAEPFVLAGVGQRGRAQLVDLEAEQIHLPGPLPLVAPQGGQPLLHCRQLLASGTERLEVDAAVAVEGAPLHGRGEQRLVVVLTVEVDEGGATLGELGEGGQVAVDVAAGAPRGGHDPAQHDLVVTGHEPALDHGLGGPGPHHAGVGPTAHQQLDGGDHEGLAGTGLPGHRGHAGAEHQ